jgi:hypothetical protein
VYDSGVPPEPSAAMTRPGERTEFDRPQCGWTDNLNDARASSICFPRNCDPELRLLYSNEAALGPRSRKGASAGAVRWYPVARVSGAAWFGAPLFFALRLDIWSDNAGTTNETQT